MYPQKAKRTQESNTILVLEGKNCQTRILYLKKISPKNKTEIETFSDVQKQIICNKPIQQEM